jgi:uncharacterized protein YecE (DUF72 family)
MRFLVGTSGYSYKEWKGTFYPEKLPANEMLAWYAQRLPAVEINNTFYRMPKTKVLQVWAEQVPEAFRFVLKASQRITHQKRLNDVEEPLDILIRNASVMQQRLGALLFQFPPDFEKNLGRLQTFLNLLGNRAPAALEFRHESWFDDEVLQCLRANSCALCIDDSDQSPRAELISTANWGYMRLRREKYTDQDLVEWLERIKSQSWNTAFVFFKHEEAGAGPELATRFVELASRQSCG